MCFADCSRFDICGDAGICLNVSATQDICFPRCSGPNQGQSDCRNGYVCGGLVFPDGGPAPEGVCDTSCLAPGNACNANFVCDAGYCVPQ
jgi:hypothetical protein